MVAISLDQEFGQIFLGWSSRPPDLTGSDHINAQENHTLYRTSRWHSSIAFTVPSLGRKIKDIYNIDQLYDFPMSAK